MTMEELEDRWMNYMVALDKVISKEDVNDFCNRYATSYEEYMTIYEMLIDLFGDISDMPDVWPPVKS